MRAEELLRAGKLDEALTELKGAVRQSPDDPKYRVFLFQLLAVNGQWQSAVTQLEVAGDLAAGNLAMVQAYREAIRCEQLRQEVFMGQSTPLIFSEPSRWLALLIQSLKLDGDGKHVQAQQMRAEALEAAPATAGEIYINDDPPQSFDWIADADLRLGPVVEAYLNGQYYWIPIESIAQIDFESPADLRDFIWTPAHFTWANGGQSVGMIPTRYPESETDPDDLTRLARKTDWRSIGDVAEDSELASELSYRGFGQRMWSTDTDDYALLDVRKLSLQLADQAGAAADSLSSSDAPSVN